MHHRWHEWRFRRWLQRKSRYARPVAQDCGAMAWSDQAIARLRTTWVERFLFRHHIRRHVFHGVMVVSFVLTATMFVLSVQRFADYAPAMERPPKIVAINVWKAWCTVNPWTKHCQPQRPVKPQT